MIEFKEESFIFKNEIEMKYKDIRRISSYSYSIPLDNLLLIANICLAVNSYMGFFDSENKFLFSIWLLNFSFVVYRFIYFMLIRKRYALIIFFDSERIEVHTTKIYVIKEYEDQFKKLVDENKIGELKN